ncbi:hypothetical protein FE784_00210 [Paenibacillus hemerocallicola]|uniref:Calcineurin-like phosphoesterase domain-containing protein n=2 Tax=Paenibacillus hemerocallicola TaxID=1172614 RepID=A0A5C4TGN8_9BACL|nr:hypothetical protein FE784_00210 [Paenibacillus hemerocallicola]
MNNKFCEEDKEAKMRAIYVADLHSDRKHYDELYTLLQENRIELLLIGGDLLAYSKSLAKQLDFIEHEWIDFVRSISIPILLIHGNIEWTGAVSRYEQLSRANVHTLLTLEPVEMDRLAISGYGISNPSPFSRKDFERRDLKCDEFISNKSIYISTVNGQLVERDAHYLNRLPSMEDELEALSSQGIWMMHAPPFETKLDVIQNGIHVGSKAIRKRIEQVQPALTLHGHIHESPYVSNSWFDRIGRTVCINPGQGADLHAVILDLRQNGELESAEHTIFGKAGLY